MPDLQLAMLGVEIVPYAAAPLLAFKLQVTNEPAAQPIQAVALQCQIRIDPLRRHYDAPEQTDLHDLFGAPDRWSQTMHSMLWTHAATSIPAFLGSTVATLTVPCSYDFNIAATKYFYALESGEIPLTLLFSGTIFYEVADGTLQVTQIPWDREATFRLPVATWRALMDHYYPNSAWLTLRQDVFDRLYRYKIQHSLPTWEQVFDLLLPAGDAEQRP